MKKKFHSIHLRNHNRICDAQKHLVQGKGNLMNEYINQMTSIELVLRVLKRLQMSFKIHLLVVRFQ